MTDITELDDRFRHHAPTNMRVEEAHGDLRKAARNAALIVNAICPPGREKSLALTKIEEAMFWANAAVARAQKVGE